MDAVVVDEDDDDVEADDEEGDRREGTRVDPSMLDRRGFRLGGCRLPPPVFPAEASARCANSGTSCCCCCGCGCGCCCASSAAAAAVDRDRDGDGGAGICSKRGDFDMGCTKALLRTNSSHLVSLRSGGATVGESRPLAAVSMEGLGDEVLWEIWEPGRVRLGDFRNLFRGLKIGGMNDGAVIFVFNRFDTKRNPLDQNQYLQSEMVRM